MKALYINTQNNTMKFIDTDTELETLYKLIDCRCIDIATRTIFGRPFDFVVDDEGLFADKPAIAAISANQKEYLVGNTLVFGCHGLSEDLEGLNDEDVNVLQAVMFEGTFNDGTKRQILLYDPVC